MPQKFDASIKDRIGMWSLGVISYEDTEVLSVEWTSVEPPALHVQLSNMVKNI